MGELLRRLRRQTDGSMLRLASMRLPQAGIGRGQGQLLIDNCPGSFTSVEAGQKPLFKVGGAHLRVITRLAKKFSAPGILGRLVQYG